MESSTTVMVLIFLSTSVLLSLCFHGGEATVVIVSKDGDGDYGSISEAISKAPRFSDTPYTIQVRSGTYKEYVVVPSQKINIKIVGDGPQQTRIVGSHYGTTLDGFVAENIGLVNSAGLKASAAVTVRNEANHSIFFQCSIEGLQDTLWAVSGRQFYKNCDIYGTVDFIYGDAAALFEDCNLYARYRPYVTFTAQSRESPDEDTAFAFQHCQFTMAPEDAAMKSKVRATLGRPWRPYSTVAVIDSFIDSMVDPAGWEEMQGQPTDKVTYVEFNNYGPGSNTSGRVNWPGVRVLSGPDEAQHFTASILLDADSWIPHKGVPYNS
ncbi:pectinesterase 2-like isoform X2 [Neltuma alba]|uniref:pectinesterase 2-like isoform X2 n=1 Tax=Neltuma alba TaxID=207710 RepID=UPI0010A2E9CE|nr:pectinesterase 2-like isoform X2 [Prosopis alba]